MTAKKKRSETKKSILADEYHRQVVNALKTEESVAIDVLCTYRNKGKYKSCISEKFLYWPADYYVVSEDKDHTTIKRNSDGKKVTFFYIEIEEKPMHTFYSIQHARCILGGARFWRRVDGTHCKVTNVMKHKKSGDEYKHQFPDAVYQGRVVTYVSPKPDGNLFNGFVVGSCAWYQYLYDSTRF